MWIYSRPSCPDRLFFVEVGDTDINSRIRGVLAHEADLNFGSSPIILREGVNSPWVSALGFTFIYLCQFLLLNTCTFLRRISGKHVALRGGHLT
jgi:hypothetical protein